MLLLCLLPSALLLPTCPRPHAITRRQVATSVAGFGVAAAITPPALAEDAGAWTNHVGAFDDAYFSDFTESKTAAGFKYKILKEGDGPKPEPFQRVYVQYKGYLLDGTQFDTSYKGNNEPFSFRLNKRKVISGWEGIVSGMKVGQRVAVLIPPEYAYGDKGIGPIPPNSKLLFYMELVSLGNIKGDKPRLSNLTEPEK